MAVLGVPAEGQDSRMLEQQQLVRDLPGDAPFDELVLERPRVAIADPTEPAGLERCTGDGVPGRPGIEGRSGDVHARTIAGATLRTVTRCRDDPERGPQTGSRSSSLSAAATRSAG